jgi:hypothetical protein
MSDTLTAQGLVTAGDRYLATLPKGGPHVSTASLPTEAAARKALPLCTGVLDYFPDALAAVAHCSKVGNDQHNPGQPLHWAKEKSTDEPDAMLRHLVDRGKLDKDGVRHSAKVAWRALALLQREIDAERAAAAVAVEANAARGGI